eukprot:6695127-Lingulodinium_polyedra.AAC.1
MAEPDLDTDFPEWISALIAGKMISDGLSQGSEVFGVAGLHWLVSRSLQSRAYHPASLPPSP